MKPESVKQMKRFLDARDLLHSARAQYETSVGALQRALDFASASMAEGYDEEAARQIVVTRALVEGLPRAAFDTIDEIADTMAALAGEVTADEEHLPAGVS